MVLVSCESILVSHERTSSSIAGTVAGDGTEAEALAMGLRTSKRPESRPLYVGGVKTVIGHCEGASGVAGVIHAAMTLHNRCIPPNRNFEFPSDKIRFDQWHIKVACQV